MTRVKLLAALMVLAASAWTAARAGTVIVVETWAYDQYSESGTATAYLGENKLRVEVAGKEGATHVIFDVENANDPVMWMIDPAAQTYTKMDAKTLKKAQDKTQQMIEMLNNYTARLSAEERADIVKQYKKQLRRADDILKYEERMKKTAYQKAAEGQKVKEWTCDHLKGMFNNEMRKEVWVAPWAELGIEPKDAAVLTAVSAAFKGFFGETVPFNNQKVEGSDKPVDGLPVKTMFYEDGSKIIRQEIKEIRREDLDPKLFEIPEGYAEEKPNLD